MKYQDTIINGTVYEKGLRECEKRYNIIYDFCSTLKKDFTVMDVGANMCYFGLRLIHDFNCNVIAFEFNQFKKREEIVRKNKTNKLLFLERKLSLHDMEIISSMLHVDLILVLSVLHHLPGDSSDWIKMFRKISDNSILEFAVDDSKRVSGKINYEIPVDGKIIGYGESHLSSVRQRPIVLLKN